MSDFENEDIDKIFEEIISSDDIKQIDSPGIDAVISIEQVSIDTLIKELIFIAQSLSRSINHVSDLVLNFMSIEGYSIEDEAREILGNMYKLSEDFDEYMIELMFEDMQDEEDEQEDDEQD